MPRIAGGIFSVALSVNEPASARMSMRHPNRSPGVTRRVALCLSSAFERMEATPSRRETDKEFSLMTQDGVQTFLPSGHLAMARPAITRPARRLHYSF